MGITYSKVPITEDTGTGAFPMPGGPIVTTQSPAAHEVAVVAPGAAGAIDPAFPVRPVAGATPDAQALDPALQQPGPELPAGNVPALAGAVAVEPSMATAAADPAPAPAPEPETKVVTPPAKAPVKTGRRAQKPV